jgi:YidC/Oxa1 family membrane protein insertase
LKYPKAKDTPNEHVRLLETDDATPFVANSGLLGPKSDPRPNHLTLLTAEKLSYQLPAGADTLVVPLRWTDEQGVTVTKSYTFKRGSYTVGISYDIDNASAKPWSAASYMQLQRHYEAVSRSMFNIETYSYRGPEIYDGKGVRKLDITEPEDRSYNKELSGGWLAALQHHFVVAAIPPADKPYSYQLKVDNNNNFVLSYTSQLQTIAPGTKGTLQETLYVGPKLQEQLAAAGHKLELTADYGRLTIIAQPLFWLLQKVHSLVGNWGLAIVLVTLLIKLAFYHLTQTSGRSMAKMRNLAPRIKALQERYKDNREQVGRAMMELYKREKINPLAGCLPILVQIPVFLAFYWVLVESVELRQAPFFGWVIDLSSRDPFFVLPLLMGVAMFFQFKINPTPSMDPMQAKIFAFMPVVMTGTMAWFPAGLVLYWLTNTLLSIAQQWQINKVVASEKPA